MDKKAELEERIRQLDEQIEEQKKRIPPHSARPQQLMHLEELEEQRDALQKELSSQQHG